MVYNTQGPNQSGLNGSGTDAEILDTNESGFRTDHIPAPAPHVDGEPPRAYALFGRFQLDAGGDAWVSAKHPVDVEEVA